MSVAQVNRRLHRRTTMMSQYTLYQNILIVYIRYQGSDCNGNFVLKGGSLCQYFDTLHLVLPEDQRARLCAEADGWLYGQQFAGGFNEG